MVTSEWLEKFKRLYFTYKDLGEVSDYIAPTNLFQYRVRLRPGTKPWKAPKQRLNPYQKYFFDKYIKESLANSMLERIIQITGQLSDWYANPKIVPKGEDKNPKVVLPINPETIPPHRVTLDYGHLEEVMPGTHINLQQEVYEYL